MGLGPGDCAVRQLVYMEAEDGLDAGFAERSVRPLAQLTR